MKRILSLVALGVGLAVSARAAVEIAVTARVGGELTGFRGDRVTVPIVVDMSGGGGEKLGSYTGRLQWDPSTLNFTCYYYSCDTLPGNFASPQFNFDSLPQGVLRFGAISPAGADGILTLTRLRFSINYEAPTSSPLTLSFSEMSAAGTFTDLLPALTVTGATFCVAQGRWGDLDSDGAANSRDALAILSRVVGLPVDTVFHVNLGDVDGDANVNTRDALIILSYAVGLDIPGQRVLLLAPTDCGTGAAKQLSVFPATAELVPNQYLQLVTQGTDAQGRAVTIPDAVWRSSDNAVAAVDASGRVLPRDAGTATITAQVGPGLRAQSTITVIARRPNWYVDVGATGSPLQLGTAAQPFDHPTKAYAVVSEGDTIHVASGTYVFTDDGELSVGAVILGGTPGDTTTRPLFRDSDNDYTALWLRGGNRTVVRNVVLENFSYAVDIDGVRNFALEDSRVVVPTGSYGSGITTCANGAIDTVRVDRSVFLGDSTGSAIENDYCVERTALLLVRDTKILYWYDGILWTDADSIEVLRSEISDNADNGIESYQEYDVSTALHVAHSRIERNSYAAIYGSYFRRIVIDTSVLRANANDAIDVEGGCCGDPPLQFYMHGDSVYMEQDADNDYWLATDDADTVSIDSTVVRFPADTGSFYAYSDISADLLRITNSKFLNAGNGSVVYFDGRVLLVDSVQFTGCNAVSGCADASAIEAYMNGVGANARVTRSRFTKQGYAIYLEGPAQTIEDVVIDSSYYAIQSYDGDTVSVTHAVLSRIVSSGIAVYGAGSGGWGPSLLAGDTISCASVAGGQKGLDIGYNKFAVENNLITGCKEGLYVYRAGLGTVVRGNTVRVPVLNGITINQYVDSFTVRVDSNGVSEADTSAVRVLNGRVVMSKNYLAGNTRYGLYIPTAAYPAYAPFQVHQNAFVGNALYGVYVASDTVDADNNWWGADAQPCFSGADCAAGRVDSTAHLAAAPGGLPTLAPPAAAAPSAISSPAQAVPIGPPAVRPARAAKQARPAAAVGTRPAGTPERAARIEHARERREAAQARRIEHEGQREAKRTERRSERGRS